MAKLAVVDAKECAGVIKVLEEQLKIMKNCPEEMSGMIKGAVDTFDMLVKAEGKDEMGDNLRMHIKLLQSQLMPLKNNMYEIGLIRKLDDPYGHNDTEIELAESRFILESSVVQGQLR